jgi:hypothetical protein
MAQRETQRQLDRRIPRWAAMLLARLAQDRPSVVTRDDIADYLAETDSTREAEKTVNDLVRLGWLNASRRKGVWTYLPPGEDEIIDPYVGLRAWVASDPSATFALAGEASAWHLGYLDRRFTGPIAVWLPEGVRPPFGLRETVSVIRLGWPEAMRSQIGPSRSLLRKRRLDLTRWADGLASFGPEALLVQLSSRPASFLPWADIAVHLDDLADDCETERLTQLLQGQSASAWQRAAYLLDLGGNVDAADDVLQKRPQTRLSHVTIGNGDVGTRSKKFGITDRLVAPLMAAAGKA